MTAAVTVRFFAGAARAMGARQRTLALAAPTTVGGLVAALGARGEAARVLGLCAWLVDASPADDDTIVRPGAVVDALPPFAGG